MDFRKKTAVAHISLMPLALVGCADEADDGAVTDEEVDKIDESAEDGANEIQEKVEEGADEAEDG